MIDKILLESNESQGVCKTCCLHRNENMQSEQCESRYHVSTIVEWRVLIGSVALEFWNISPGHFGDTKIFLHQDNENKQIRFVPAL